MNDVGQRHNHPQWWEGREFEHRAESLAIVKLLGFVARRKSIVDIGAGFGRLTPVYSPFFSKITLVDESPHLLRNAQSYLGNLRGIEFKAGEAIRLPLSDESFDVALCIHLLDSFEDPTIVISEIRRVLKKEGFAIIEMTSKVHHPVNIIELLKGNDFTPIEILSVSNLGYRILTRLVPLPILLSLEDKLQKFLPKFNSRLPLGNSTFILSQKRGAESEEHLLKDLEF